ncbi:MAG: tRNA lysidine(34) synthetase TilS [Pseudomonadota bacterium]
MAAERRGRDLAPGPPPDPDDNDLTGDLIGTAHRALDRLAGASPRLGVAVSGGSDSLALMLLAADWAEARGRVVSAITIDHGLRAAAAAETAAVARIAATRGLPVEILHVAVAPGGNLLAAARDARMAALAAWSAAAGDAPVALAHTSDDQAETMIMRLRRGAGADGLALMAPRRGPFIRPLLAFGRAALRQHLRARGLGWIEDPGNADAGTDRIRARQMLKGLNQTWPVTRGLLASAGRLSRQVDALDWATRRLAADCGLTQNAAGGIALSPLALAEAPEELIGRLAARAIWALTGKPYAPRHDVLQRAISALRAMARDHDMPEMPLAQGTVLQGAREDGVSLAVIAREVAAVAPPVWLTGPAAVTWDARTVIAPPFPPGISLGALGRVAPAAVAHLMGPDDQAAWIGAGSAARAASPVLRDRDGAIIGVSTRLGWAGPADLMSSNIRDLVAERLADGARKRT